MKREISYLLILLSGNLWGQSDSAMDLELRRIATENVSRLVGGPGDVWANAGNGGYLLHAEQDLTGDGKPEVLLASTLNVFKYSTEWLVYSRQEDGTLRSYEGTYRASVISDRPGRNAAGHFVIANEFSWDADGLHVRRFSEGRILTEILPHVVSANEQPEIKDSGLDREEKIEAAGQAFDLGETWPSRHLPVRGIRLADYVAGKPTWKNMNFERAAPGSDGYFIAAEDAEEMRANTAFTPQVALEMLRKLPPVVSGKAAGQGISSSKSIDTGNLPDKRGAGEDTSIFSSAYAGLWVSICLLIAAGILLLSKLKAGGKKG